MTEVQELAQVSPCQDNPQQLCRINSIPFFRESWYQRFIFRRGLLIGVQLAHLETPEVHSLIDKWLDSGYRYIPVAITSAGQELDLFAEIKLSGKEGARKAVNNFVRRTAADLNTTYLYLDLDDREHLLDNYYSFYTILAQAPRDLIGIEEVVRDKYLTITFIAPVAEWQDKGQPRP
ncbi:MAG: hypothetical protein IJU79_01660 [Desulfovibrionaceae bacterium]|nr:hypothetical protein [Desulfovibrionaceae bacterium]